MCSSVSFKWWKCGLCLIDYGGWGALLIVRAIISPLGQSVVWMTAIITNQSIGIIALISRPCSPTRLPDLAAWRDSFIWQIYPTAWPDSFIWPPDMTAWHDSSVRQPLTPDRTARPDSPAGILFRQPDLTAWSVSSNWQLNLRARPDSLTDSLYSCLIHIRIYSHINRQF